MSNFWGAYHSVLFLSVFFRNQRDFRKEFKYFEIKPDKRSYERERRKPLVFFIRIVFDKALHIVKINQNHKRSPEYHYRAYGKLNPDIAHNRFERGHEQR